MMPETTYRPILRSLELRNILSFGEPSKSFPLSALNVLIGPNGSGKSNLIEAIGLLKAAPGELAVPVREGGGVRDWLWKGGPKASIAMVEALVQYPAWHQAIRYRLAFTAVGQRLEVTDERIEGEEPAPGKERPFILFGYEHGRPMLSVTSGRQRALRREDLDPQKSILSQRKDPDQYPELTWLGRAFDSFRLYRDWNIGRYTPPRVPQPADLPNDFLSDDARNLGLVLNRLRKDVETKRAFLDYLRSFYGEVEDVDVSIEGGTVQLFLQEKGYTVPATRLSDGTLRWISLLTILLHPTPPPLVCIEEPEIGLHPDIMPTLAEVLRKASERMQLVVTTHSDALVDALTDTPESVVVCEREAGRTVLRRLSREELGSWLARYSLGQLWRKGEIGGTRW